jgi:hypothetical protein
MLRAWHWATVKCEKLSNLPVRVLWLLHLHVTRHTARRGVAVLVSGGLADIWHLKPTISACLLLFVSVEWVFLLK